MPSNGFGARAGELACEPRGGTWGSREGVFWRERESVKRGTSRGLGVVVVESAGDTFDPNSATRNPSIGGAVVGSRARREGSRRAEGGERVTPWERVSVFTLWTSLDGLAQYAGFPVRVMEVARVGRGRAGGVSTNGCNLYPVAQYLLCESCTGPR